MPKKTDKLTYEALRERMEPVAQKLLDEYQHTKQLLVDVTHDPEAHVQAMCFATMGATQTCPKTGGLLIAYLLLERLERDEQAEHASMERDLRE